MPIANSFLSSHRVLNVKNPVFSLSGEIPTLQGSFVEVACKRFSSELQANASSKTLIQNWPASKYVDIQPFSYSTKIELPVLFDKNGIRTQETEFFNNWLYFMLSTYDTIQGTNQDLTSLIVENASINVSPEEITLSITFKSNFPLDWHPSIFNGALTTKTLHARKAKNYDTFVKMNNYENGKFEDMTGLGWNNTFGVSNFQITYTSEIEEIYLTKHDSNKDLVINGSVITSQYHHLTDMINVKSVSYNGDIGIFGPELEMMGASIQKAGSFMFDTVTSDIFSMSLSQGGIQIYIGELDPGAVPVSYDNLYPLTFLPTGIFISNASSELSAGQIYKHSRQFHGIFTDTPKKIRQDGTEEITLLT